MGMQVLTNYASGGNKELYQCGYNDWEVKHSVDARGDFKRSPFF
jgi:hypothetical protein